MYYLTKCSDNTDFGYINNGLAKHNINKKTPKKECTLHLLFHFGCAEPLMLFFTLEKNVNKRARVLKMASRWINNKKKKRDLLGLLKLLPQLFLLHLVSVWLSTWQTFSNSKNTSRETSVSCFDEPVQQSVIYSNITSPLTNVIDCNMIFSTRQRWVFGSIRAINVIDQSESSIPDQCNELIWLSQSRYCSVFRPTAWL